MIVPNFSVFTLTVISALIKVCYLVSKISPKIDLIHRLRQFLPIKAIKQIYLTTIQTLFDYGLTVYGSTSQKNLKLLQRLQNRCARAVTGIFDYTSSLSALIKTLGGMNMSQRHSYFISCLVFKSLNGNVPVSISNNFFLCQGQTKSQYPQCC